MAAAAAAAASCDAWGSARNAVNATAQAACDDAQPMEVEASDPGAHQGDMAVPHLHSHVAAPCAPPRHTHTVVTMPHRPTIATLHPPQRPRPSLPHCTYPPLRPDQLSVTHKPLSGHRSAFMQTLNHLHNFVLPFSHTALPPQRAPLNSTTHGTEPTTTIEPTSMASSSPGNTGGQP